MHREVGFLPLSLLSRMEGAVLAKFNGKLRIFLLRYGAGIEIKIAEGNCKNFPPLFLPIKNHSAYYKSPDEVIS